MMCVSMFTILRLIVVYEHWGRGNLLFADWTAHTPLLT
jgi:hypothetical protein